MSLRSYSRLLLSAFTLVVASITSPVNAQTYETVVVVGRNLDGAVLGDQTTRPENWMEFAGLFIGGSMELPPGANTRTVPKCLREQVAQNAVQASLRGGNNPGIFLYSNLGDPRLSGEYWGKYQINFISTIIDGGVIRGTATVSIHYEYNRATGQYTSPPHFNNSEDVGCRN